MAELQEQQSANARMQKHYRRNNENVAAQEINSQNGA